MNTPETINIEKYAHALNELIGIDSAYLGDTDKNVNAIIEVIVAAKKLVNRVKELEAENRNLEYVLLGVMHSVDKWLDGAELEMDEVSRAATVREKTLQIVEKLTEENEKLNKLLEHCEDDGEYWEGKYNNAVNDTIHRMQSMIKEECIAGGIYPAFVARVVENVGKKMLEGKNDV